MEYSDDILARVRAALIDYHAASHANGRKRSWSVIADTIVQDFPDLAPPLEDDDNADWPDAEGETQVLSRSVNKDPNKPFAEALRRFATGTQVPSKERLDALCELLLSKSFLNKADLESSEAGHALAHALAAFFGKESEGPLSSDIAGRFASERRQPSGRAELSFLTINEASAAPSAIEDLIYNLPQPPQSTRREALVRLLSRTGGSEQRFQGWLYQTRRQTCLVLQDSLRGAASIHIVLDRKVRAGDTPATIMLVKSQDFGPRAPSYEKGNLSYVPRETGGRDPALEKIRDRIWQYRQVNSDD